jgi:ribonuclease Y
MEVIAGAALIAVGIVAAAAVYARFGARTQQAAPPVAAPRPVARNGDLPDATAELLERERTLRSSEIELASERAGLAGERVQLTRELERVSGLSVSRAKQILLKEIEEDARHDAARRIRQIEEETRRDAERRVRNILSVCMQRLAAGHAAETTVSVVQLSADDMKGRIIGREGRNIRVLENLTGVDFISTTHRAQSCSPASTGSGARSRG